MTIRESNTGIELLIHIGLDTVNLKGEHFDANVQINDLVKAGDILEKFDIQSIQDAGYDTTVPIIITNTNDFSAVKTNSLGVQVGFGDEILSTTVANKSSEKDESFQQA